jgi:hypothetical protein
MKQVQRRVLGSRPGRQAGLISSSLGLALLVLAGSAAVIAGGLNLQSASSRGSDAEQAREAAEEGFNRIIDLLNDPGNSYLLVTKWANWSSNPVTLLERQTCKITSSSAGATSVASIIQTPTPLPSVGNGRELRYTLESYTPPAHPGAAPTTCPKFGNLAGGTASLRVLGEVLRNGTVIASSLIERSVVVDALADGSNSSAPTNSANPFAFIGTGSGSSGFISVEKDPSIMTRIVQDSGTTQWQYDTSDTPLTINCLGDSVASCRSGSSSLSSSFPVAGLPVSEFLNLFGSKPPIPTGTPLITSRDWSAASIVASGSGTINYPYDSGTTPRGNCKQTQVPNQAGQAETVIACKVSEINLDGRNLNVNTNSFPVIFYMMASSGTAKIYLKNAQIINSLFSSSRSTQPKSWNRLRIFGDPRASYLVSTSVTPSACDNDSTKETWLIEGSGRINGAFIWAPTVTLELKEPSGIAKTEYTLFGAAWACKIKYEKFVRHLINPAGTANDAINEVFGITPQILQRYSARGTQSTSFPAPNELLRQ